MANVASRGWVTTGGICRDLFGLGLLYQLWAYISEIPLTLPLRISGTTNEAIDLGLNGPAAAENGLWSSRHRLGLAVPVSQQLEGKGEQTR